MKARRLAVHGGLVRPSVYIRRSKVTISLEPSFWEAFQEIAAEQGKTVGELAAEIERNRNRRPERGNSRLHRRILSGGDKRAAAMIPKLCLVLLFVVTLALMGCPGPNYAPYDNMNNNSPG
jgi:predicted DNA-binding ribbon-helix-helix protein